MKQKNIFRSALFLVLTTGVVSTFFGATLRGSSMTYDFCAEEGSLCSVDYTPYDDKAASMPEAYMGTSLACAVPFSMLFLFIIPILFLLCCENRIVRIESSRYNGFRFPLLSISFALIVVPLAISQNALSSLEICRGNETDPCVHTYPNATRAQQERAFELANNVHIDTMIVSSISAGISQLILCLLPCIVVACQSLFQRASDCSRDYAHRSRESRLMCHADRTRNRLLDAASAKAYGGTDRGDSAAAAQDFYAAT